MNNWIASETKPEHNKAVLTFDHIIGKPVIDVYDTEKDKWLIEWTYIFLHEVSHWMELPKSPS